MSGRIRQLMLSLLLTHFVASYDAGTAFAAENDAAGSTPDTKIYTLAEVDRKPEVKKELEPKSRKKFSSREAFVTILIEQDGTVSVAELAKSVDKEFGQLAVETAKQLVFKPALKNGKPVRCAIVYMFGAGTRVRVESR